jgi:WD40 repeat protein/serine/threonine protein kinase
MQLGQTNVDSSFGRDRNLLFSVFALQLRFVNTKDFLDAAAAWSLDPSRNIADRLVDMGALTEKERMLVDGLAEHAVQQHEGDERLTLDTFGGESAVSEQLSGLSKEDRTRLAQTKLGIPLDVEDIDADDISTVLETPGRYTKKSEYSRGGMGRILLVHDAYLSRDIALKELLPSVIGSSEPTKRDESPIHQSGQVMVRFLREAKITGQLEHPSIVPVYELGHREDGTLYYTMKLVRGKTMALALKEARNIESRLRLLTHFIDLCHAIAYSHSRNVIHRDIKPSNTMIGEFGETVVIDWGLAKVIGKEDPYADDIRASIHLFKEGKEIEINRTEAGARLGTPEYMAPEQAEGNIVAIDQRSDVFCLGTVLYEILTGKTPFSASKTEQVMFRIINNAPTPMGEFEPDVPPELASICLKALEKNKNDRYQSAKELAEELERFQAGAFVKVYGYNLRETVTRYYKRYRAPLNVAAAALVVIIAAGIFSYVNIRSARDDAVAARITAEKGQYVAQLRLAQLHMDSAEFRSANEALWATQPVYRQWEWGFLLNESSQDLFTVEGSNVFSIDQDRNLFVTHGANQPLALRDAVTGETVFELTSDTPRVSLSAFNPASPEISAAFWDGSVRTWSLENGNQTSLLSLQDNLVEFVRYSGDGTVMAAVGIRGECVLWTIDDGDRREIDRIRVTDIDSIPYSRESRAATEYDHRFQINENGTRLLFAMGNLQTREGVFAVYSNDEGALIETASASGFVPRFRPGSSQIISTLGSNVVIYQEGENGNLEVSAEMSGHAGSINDLRISKNGELVATASSDGTARLWDLNEGEERIVIRPGENGIPVELVEFSPDSKLIATASRDLVIRIWAADTGALIQEKRGHERPLHDLAFTSDNSRLFSGGYDAIKAWNPTAGIGLSTPYRAAAAVKKIAVDSAGKLLAISSLGARYCFYSVENETPLISVASLNVSNRVPMALSSDGTRSVLAPDGFSVCVVDPSTGAVLNWYRGHNGLIEALNLNPEGDLVVSAARDDTAHIWSLDTMELQIVLGPMNSWVTAAAFSNDGQFVATGTETGTITIWDSVTGTRRWEQEGHSGRVTNVQFLRDDTSMISTSADEYVVIWKTTDGTIFSKLNQHRRVVNDAIQNPSGSRVFTGSRDGDIRVWNPDDYSEMAVLNEHWDWANTFAWMSNSQVFFSGDNNGLVYRWEAFPHLDSDSNQFHSQVDFDTYKAAKLNSPFSLPVHEAPEEIVLVPRGTIGSSLNDLSILFSARSDSTEEPNIVVEGADILSALSPLRFTSGDQLNSIDGKPISSIEEINGIVESLDAGTNTTVDIQITRRGTAINVRCIEFEIDSKTQIIELTNNNALRIFSELLDYLNENRELIENSTVRIANLAGLRVNEDSDIVGWTIGGRANSPAADRYRELGLTIYDRVISINGQAVADFDTLIANVQSIIESITNGNDFELVLDVRRGVFQQHRLVFAFEP